MQKTVGIAMISCATPFEMNVRKLSERQIQHDKRQKPIRLITKITIKFTL